MYKNEIASVADAASGKIGFLKKNPLGYLVSSVLAGIYIGIGVLLSNTVGGALSGEPYARLLTGCTFGIALSLVVMAGAELFTGNNLVMGVGVIKKTVTPFDAALLFVICWIGNLLGGVILGTIYHLTGLYSGATGLFMANAAFVKVSAGWVELFTRGILCNFLVCLAVWIGTRTKSDAGRLIMIFWCLLAFVTTGFEHSVANMTLFTVVGLDVSETGLGVLDYGYNLFVVTLGNMAGGIVGVAIPYSLMAKKGD